jgi:hypothetical protein
MYELAESCKKCGMALHLCKCCDVSDSSLNVSLSEIKDLVKDLIKDVEEYVNYEHDGDPWSEDYRVMGEMSLDAWGKGGRLDILKAMIEGGCCE